MAEAWFRKWMGFGYVPIRWQGWATLTVAAIIALPSGMLSFTMADNYPVASWICAALFVGAVVVQHSIVLWKLERTYGS